MTGQNANADQIAFWNGLAGERWAKFQDQLDKGMAPITAGLLPFVNAKPGEHVLDLGCGCGGTALKYADAVGASGSVTGVDISRPMLSIARDRAHQANANIRFIEADAAVARFTPEYDLAASRFGVMFFADPIAAFANIRAALKPRGRLAFVCWRPLAENMWSRVPMETAKPLLPPQPPADPLAPGPFAFADAARTKSLLEQAGFKNIRIEKLDSAMWLGSDAEEAATQALTIGPLARALVEVDTGLKNKIRALVKARLAEFAGPGGIAPPAACWLVGAEA
jgi:SAM-dependent methyltransferase